MNPLFHTRRFSTRLIVGLFVLILITTLSAGVPAYWLTRTQLEQQAWSQVGNAQQATASLLQAEQERLENLTTLFAERPTLQRLLYEATQADLSAYLQAFREQSALDLLLVCGPDGRRLAGSAIMNACLAPIPASFRLLDGRPVLLGSFGVNDNRDGAFLGTAVSGVWLDAGFLRRLAANTGAQQSILLADGTRSASSFPGATAVAPAGLAQREGELAVDGRRFYAARFPLPTVDAGAALFSEVALPVDDLIATENRALLILVVSTGLVALAGVALGTWYIRWLTGPLQHLTAVAEKISQGDFVMPIPRIADPVELATLAEALDKSQGAMLTALEERSQDRDWLNTLIQSIVEGVITFDTDGCVTFLSQGAEAITGWPAAEAVGASINEILAPANPAGQGETFLDYVPPPGEKRQIEVTLRHGRSAALAVTGARLVPPNSDTVQVALVLRDVTAEEAQRHLRSYFLANITHEFRTPLSTLNASIELLLNEAEALSAAEMRQLLKPTYLSLLGLQTLVDNLLESSRIEAGRFTVRRQPVKMNEVVANALHIVRPLLERRRQRLSLAEPARIPEITADAARLTQVLVNLLTNASKYSPIGAEIDLRIEQREGGLRVTVFDRGPGIPPEERLNLFRRFVRHGQEEGEQYGIGLGLHVVKTTIEAHGGAVGVDDWPGGGAAFWFEIPPTPEPMAER